MLRAWDYFTKSHDNKTMCLGWVCLGWVPKTIFFCIFMVECISTCVFSISSSLYWSLITDHTSYYAIGSRRESNPCGR